MPDGEFSLEFIERVRAGLVDGWRAQNSAQGEFIVDLKGSQAWMLRPDEPSPLPAKTQTSLRLRATQKLALTELDKVQDRLEEGKPPKDATSTVGAWLVALASHHAGSK